MTISSNRGSRPRMAFWTWIICLTVGGLATARGTRAQTPSTAARDAVMVKPFVSETTFLVVKVDTTRIDLPDLAGPLQSMSADAVARYEQVSQTAGARIERLRRLVDNQPIYATVGIPISRTRIPVYGFMKKPPAARVGKLLDTMRNEFQLEGAVHGEYIVTSLVRETDVAASLAAGPRPRKEIADAFAAVAGAPVQVLLLPPAYVRRTVLELMPELPSQLGGGPSRLLTDGLQWAALGINLGRLQASVVIQSSSETAARDLAAHLPKMLQSAYDAVPPIHEQFPPKLAQLFIHWVNPRVEGRRITIRVDGLKKMGVALKMLASVGQTIDETAARRKNQSRFKQILLGMHNYYAANKMFPPADKYRGKDGKFHLSWRVYILPYVEQAKLYKQFRLDQPWDSPHNKKLIAKMPDIYQSREFELVPKTPVKPGYTTFVTPVGDGTAFGGPKSPTFHEFKDGTSCTAILVEVKPERAVPWTAPDDYVFAPKNPAAGLLIGPDGRCLCGLADGSAIRLRGDLPPHGFLNLFQTSDGNPIDYSKIR